MKVKFVRFRDSVNVIGNPVDYVPNIRLADKVTMWMEEHYLYIELNDKTELVMVPRENILQVTLAPDKNETEPPTNKSRKRR